VIPQRPYTADEDLIVDTIQVNPYLSFTLPLIPLSSGGGFVFNSPNTTPPSDKAEKTLCADISLCKCAWMKTAPPFSIGHRASSAFWQAI